MALKLKKYLKFKTYELKKMKLEFKK